MSSPTTLSRELRTMQRVAIDALGVMPKRSFYRKWSYELIAEEIKAVRYPRLKGRLMEYVRKNGMEGKFNLEQ